MKEQIGKFIKVLVLMKENIDVIFKSAIMVIGILLLSVYYMNSSNGRYVYLKMEGEAPSFKVFDSRTGSLHSLSIVQGKRELCSMIEFNIVTGVFEEQKLPSGFLDY